MYGYQFVYFYELVNTKVKGEFFNNEFIFKKRCSIIDQRITD